MQGGYNVAPLIDAVEKPDLGPIAAKVGCALVSGSGRAFVSISLIR